MNVLSSNGLDIQLEASAWFQPKYEDLGKLHKEKSEAYKQRILLPAIRSAARSVVGRYTPEQLYSSKRDAIQTEIFVETQKIVDDQYIQLNEILVRDVTLPPSIKMNPSSRSGYTCQRHLPNVYFLMPLVLFPYHGVAC